MGTFAGNCHLTIICVLEHHFLFMEFAQLNLERFKFDFRHEINKYFQEISELSKLLVDEGEVDFFFFGFGGVIAD